MHRHEAYSEHESPLESKEIKLVSPKGDQP